ncbi:group II intron maturase-specific domain-containing protein [Terrisporobacter sp.]|uniref:group II intron maturase-specific domain-containing protein n=1 Tax=Terrisporobacter sp. TaxID=1965305 RepID=UPI003FCCB188
MKGAGWTNYFRVASCKRELLKLYSWIKRRLRMKIPEGASQATQTPRIQRSVQENIYESMEKFILNISAYGYSKQLV